MDSEDETVQASFWLSVRVSKATPPGGGGVLEYPAWRMDRVDLVFHHAGERRAARVFVLAELGVNHDGDVDQARRLIEAAAAAGADGVKVQCFRPERLLSPGARLAAYQAAGESDAASMLGRLALGVEALIILREHAHDRGLAFVATPFSLADVADLAAIDVDAVKIASPDVVNTPLLDAALGLPLPVLVSTGAATLDEVAPAAVLLHRHRAGGALLQCVSSYPTADGAAGLGGIAALAREYRLPVGYSDHTTSIDMGAWAVAAGACVLEKHLTYDRAAAGPDHAASLEPADFQRYVSAGRAAAAALGPIGKTVQEAEREVRTLCRQGLYAARDLAVGDVVAEADVRIQRPSADLPAAALGDVVGRRVVRAVAVGRAIARDALA